MALMTWRAASCPSGRLNRLEASIRRPGALLDVAASHHLSVAVIPGGATVQKGEL